ncbi:unnamed protein product [Prunus armeniaca]
MPKLIQLDLDKDTTIAKVDEVFSHGESRVALAMCGGTLPCEERELLFAPLQIANLSSFTFQLVREILEKCTACRGEELSCTPRRDSGNCSGCCCHRFLHAGVTLQAWLLDCELGYVVMCSIGWGSAWAKGLRRWLKQRGLATT